MGDDEIRKLSDDLSEIKERLARIEENQKQPCANHDALVNKQSNVVARLHDRIDEHIHEFHSENSINTAQSLISKHVEECHSTRSIRENWALIIAFLCVLVTFLSPFIQKWLG